MAVFASNMSSEAGLRLLLVPLGSNIVVRTACCSVGIVLPVYSTFKAIEANDQDEQQKWLLYWAAYGSFSVAELFTDKFLYWFPLYYHMKFAFLVWLQLPSVDGARQLYMNHLRPFLRRHQPRLDQLVGFLYGEMAKFVSNHEAEFQFAKALLAKILLSANDVVKELVEETQVELEFCQELVVEKQVELEFCLTEVQVADILTKSLTIKKYVQFRTRLGMRDFGSREGVEK